MVYRRFTLVASLVAVFLIGCTAAGAQPTGHSAAAQAVETYLQALAAKNEDAYSQWICPDWEMDAFLEFDAYAGMETQLDHVACSQTGAQEGAGLVACQGQILLSYGAEREQVDLSQRTYRVISQGGNWQVCGFSTPAP